MNNETFNHALSTVAWTEINLIMDPTRNPPKPSTPREGSTIYGLAHTVGLGRFTQRATDVSEATQ